ncbi:unnamed protein product [Heterobilharzia americana]|nr:unnamed protein product [Heterobilharzia americana]
MSIVKNWWMKNDGTTGKKHSSKDIQPIGAFLQQKFSRGVDYNLKIVIRGDRSVGKSTLLSRLKGEQFKEEYIPSNEIQLANIHWDHKNSQSVIKVEVWDVVDKGKPRNTPKGLKVFRKLTNNPPDVTIAGETFCIHIKMILCTEKAFTVSSLYGFFLSLLRRICKTCAFLHCIWKNFTSTSEKGIFIYSIVI